MRTLRIVLASGIAVISFVCPKDCCPAAAAAPVRVATTLVTTLDGNRWLLVPDPENVGRDQQWWRGPVAGAKPTRVPWIIQDAFPGYHGVAWYWLTFAAPANPNPGGRYLLRFWQVDYLAEVWLNGRRIGDHEGGEDPFEFDVTEAVKSGGENLLAVRVLNPTHQRIDGIVLNETPHRNKALPYGAGSAWDQGGILDSVELLAVPAVRVADLFARPDWKSGEVAIDVQLTNASDRPVRSQLDLSVAPATNGPSGDTHTLIQELPPGSTVVRSQLKVREPRLWQLNDPFLYRVTARVSGQGDSSVDEQSARCGFREFHFENGAFRLNGRRLFLRCSHTGNCCPIGLEMPHDPDLLRRDLLNCKVMGFNAIRFIAGVAKRYQLDLCDELGLMVYEEAYAAWCLGDSPKMGERFDASTLGMIRRDRNHPSIVMWGLLNETPDGALFRHAVAFLPKLRQLDDSRMVMLSSGRWDLGGGTAVGIESWHAKDRIDPNVNHNPTKDTVRALGITWLPGRLGFHPGRDGEYGVVRWTAPAAGEIRIKAEYVSIAEHATTDVHLLHNGSSLWNGFLNVQGGGNSAVTERAVVVKAGDTIDCAVGRGNGDYGADSTGLTLVIHAGGKTFDAAADFGLEGNPNGPWSYGWFAAEAKPNLATFQRFDQNKAESRIGSMSNPGSSKWEDVLDDIHPYKGVPHTAQIIQELRTAGTGKPVFISEYGIGSAVDLVQVVKRYEQLGKAEVEDAQFYRHQRDRFLIDWHRWHLDEVFARPEDFFAASLAKMAGQRALGLNAIRSNPQCAGHSLTGTVDQGMTGEGLTTTFRELKPGTIEAICDGFAPLRWCLFVEPVHVYRGAKVHIEAVLANEDALRPGEYPVRLEIVGPKMTRVFQKDLTIRIPEPQPGKELPLVLPVLSEDVVVDGPAGTCRFLASFLQKAGAAGGSVEFFVADRAEMPPVQAEVVLWGEDPELAGWLTERGIRTRRPGSATSAREVILVGRKAPDDAKAFRDLATRVARGSTAVFLCPQVFRKGDQPMGWAPLVNKGSWVSRPSWLYLKDEWAKQHPIFEGLQCGGLLDLTYYRELIPAECFDGQEPPGEAVAGAINAAQGYSSGLLVSVYRLGAGRLVLNTMRVRDCLGQHPAAERLLRNMLRYAAQQTNQPLAELPVDFSKQLSSFGYGE